VRMLQVYAKVKWVTCIWLIYVTQPATRSVLCTVSVNQAVCLSVCLYAGDER